MKLAAVVLNYNDYENTRKQVERIRSFSVLSSVIVVDNCSTDGSREQLSALSGEKLRLLYAEKNGGYGAGNDLGIRYAIQELSATHVLVANPDTEFSEECLSALLSCFSESEERGEKTGIVSAVMRDRQNGRQSPAWPLRPWLLELLNSGPVCRRVFSRWLNYSPRLFASGESPRGTIQVGAVHGSMLMLSAAAYLASGGYDPRVFLYGEENILGMRMKRAGFRTLLLRGQSYFHENGGSVSKSLRGMLRRQRLRQRSERYYYGEYLGISAGQKLFTLFFQQLVLLECRIAERFL